MERQAELEWIRRFLAHLETGTTELAPDPVRVPSTRYTDPDHCARERIALLRRWPCVVGLSADLPGPGRYFCATLAGVPILVLRGRDEGVRAFVNLCRHRGSPIAEGRGRLDGGRLRCPFHAWTYDLEGRLVDRPNAREAFETGREGLAPLVCVESDGVILVRLEGEEPIDVARVLRGVGPDFRALDLSAFHHFETRTTSWSCNWKLLLATFLESYHVFSLHRESVHPWYFSHPMVHDDWDGNLRFPVARRTIAELARQPEDTWHLADHATVQWFVKPHALFSHTRDYLLLWRFESPRPDRAEVTTSLYVREPVDSEANRSRLSKAFDGQMQIAGAEDFPLQEKIQVGLESGEQAEVVFGRNEVAAIACQAGLEVLLARPAEDLG